MAAVSTTLDVGAVDLEALSLASISINLALLGMDLVSDIIFIVLLLGGAFLKPTATVKLAAAVFIVARFTHPVFTTLIIGSLCGVSIIKRENYQNYLDIIHWREYSFVYSCLVLLTVLESSVVKYLPWLSTPFCNISGGFPDMFCFRLCSFGKLTQSIISTVVQLSVLLSESHEAYSPSCDFILVVSLASSIVPLVINGIEVIFRQATTLDKDDTILPSHSSMVSSPLSDIELMPSKSRAAKRISLTLPSTVDSSSSVESYIVKLPTVSMTSSDFKMELIKYYRSVAPAMISSIDNIMSDYRGYEQDLVVTLMDIYKKPVLSYVITLSSQSILSSDFHQGLTRYFTIVAPELVGNVGSLLLKYRCREQELLDTLQEKYSKIVIFSKL